MPPGHDASRVPRAGGRVLDGRYEIGRRLGTGGMAEVHVARDLLLGREVAVKLFRREVALGPDLRLQEIEARVVAALNHSALTTLLDAGVDAADPDAPQIFLVMEYVRGENLKERLRRGPLEVSEACWLGFDLAEGLDYMHQSGFLHRDVKPANILISSLRSVRPVVAKLTDFGIAAPIGQPDLSEYTVGTAAYLSPEQVEGHDARPESDVYSLGLVLLEAMTGRVAFPGTVEESAFARLDRDPRIPDDVPEAVVRILARMTARDPAQRGTLHQAAVELQQFLVDDLLRRREAASAQAAVQAAPAGAAALGDLPGGAPDRVLERLVRLAARALGATHALLLLEDGERVRVQAQHGWAPGSLGSELPTSPGFPPRGDRPWVLTDAPALGAAGPATRTAAGAPLITHDGQRIGTIAVLADEQRAVGGADLAALADAAELAVHEIELRAAARRALLRSLEPGRM